MVPRTAKTILRCRRYALLKLSTEQKGKFGIFCFVFVALRLLSFFFVFFFWFYFRETKQLKYELKIIELTV